MNLKSYFLRTSILFTVLFQLFSCTTLRKVDKRVIKEPSVIENEEIYIPHVKTERKIFFPKTPKVDKWVDSVYSQLSIDEKIGQLFMVAAYSNKDSAHVRSIDKLINENKIGGLIFFQGGPSRQARLTNRYQAISKVPLFIGIDAEWGLAMRLDSTYRYPWNMTLGAIKDLKLIEKLGVQMAKENKRLGIHFNFAPVVDINTNPKNPIIGTRSFGETKVNVANHGVALMNGFQSQGVYSTAKHFPGHGDTSSDSHTTLPVVNATKDQIDLIELYPYKRMFDEGLASVMVAHLNIPSLEPRLGYPTSISNKVVTDLLKKDLGFDGLIFTDALNMKGASNFKKPGDIDLEAFLAGNDILLFPENVPLAIEKICMAYQEGIISEDRLSESVKKILRYKYNVGLKHFSPIKTDNLYQDLNLPSNEALQYELYENAITVLKNHNNILPIKDLSQKIAYVKLGDSENSSFLTTLKKYTEVVEVSDSDLNKLNNKLKEFDLVVVGYHKTDKAWKNHDFTQTELIWLQDIAKNNTVILDVFAKPYSLLDVKSFDDIEGLVVSYQNSDISQIVSSELLFGAIEAKGKLPVSINDFYEVGEGMCTDKLNRLGYSMPENVGVSSEKLNEIEKYARKAIKEKMAPGMQILVARKGKVIYQKSFGNFTYEPSKKVENTDLYDVASLTKVLATLPLVIQVYDKKKVDLETTLSEMLSDFKKSNKKNMTFKELLSHYGGMQAWKPFYKETLDQNNQPLEKYYRTYSTIDFTTKVADNLYLRDDYNDTIFKQIVDSPISNKKEYKYSDYTFIILKKYIEKVYDKSLDVLVKENFYQSMGMNLTMYNPLNHFSKNIIAPTEIDNYFRHDTIQGYVHDMKAAMEGGVGGHAGIFSNALDVAKMMQMYLQKGNYGGYQYFSSKSFDEFNTCWFCSEGNRRGLGFDKPQLGTSGPTCGCVSPFSFGHTGFTGTMAWADPETEIVYIFLSNRTYPDSNLPNKLSKENIREDIQKVIQEAIIKE